MNRKGTDLMEEVPGLLISLLVIVLIIVAAVMIYNVFSDQETQNAKNTLAYVQGKIDYLKDGESNLFPVSGFKGGGNWMIVGWSKDDKSRPDKCFFNSCLCVCKQTSGGLTKSNFASMCANGGYCNSINVNGITTNIIYLGGSSYEYIPLSEKFIEVSITKQKNGINISMDGGTSPYAAPSTSGLGIQP